MKLTDHTLRCIAIGFLNSIKDKPLHVQEEELVKLLKSLQGEQK